MVKYRVARVARSCLIYFIMEIFYFHFVYSYHAYLESIRFTIICYWFKGKGQIIEVKENIQRKWHVTKVNPFLGPNAVCRLIFLRDILKPPMMTSAKLFKFYYYFFQNEKFFTQTKIIVKADECGWHRAGHPIFTEAKCWPQVFTLFNTCTRIHPRERNSLRENGGFFWREGLSSVGRGKD